MKTYLNRVLSSVTALSLVAVSFLPLVAPATAYATAPIQEFSASTSPTTIASPGTQAFTVTFTNDPTSDDAIKSGRVTLPAGFVLQTPPTPVLSGVTDWEVCSAAAEIQFGTIGGAAGVAPGASFSLTFTATVSAGAGAHTFVARAFKNSSCNPGGGAEFGSNQTPIIVTVNNAPVANALAISTNYETAVSSAVTATDADSNPLTYAVVSNPSHGALSGFSASTGAFTYTPDATYSGPDSFTFKANDGTVDSTPATVSITVGDAPVVTECSDGIDNDGDLLIDFPADTGCTDINDDSENTPPVITLTGSTPVSVTLNNAYTELGATALDAEDSPEPAVVVGGDVVNTAVIGAYVVTYNATDSDGAPAVQVTRTVNVVAGDNQCNDGVDNDEDGAIDFPADTGCTDINDDSENTPPVITLTGSTPVSVTLNNAYTELGATALDAEDSPEPAVVVGGDVVNTAVAGAYTVTYNATDSDGAPAVQVTRTVNVVAGDNQCNDGVDNDEDGAIDFPADTGCTDINDDSENTPPVITLTLGASPYDTATVNLLTTDTYTELGATADDAEDSPEPTVVVGGDVVNTAVAGAYTVTYNATDSDGAPAVQVTRTVNVSTAPIVPQCSDDRDNDEDRLTDAQDPGCWTNPNDSETYDANDNDETGPVVQPTDVCSNIEGAQASVPEGMTENGGICEQERRNSSGSRPTGSVLGASTGQVLGESCGLYMDQYLKRGNPKNNSAQVTKLQAFLVKHGFGTFTPTGFFGPLTEASVKAFQAKYSNEVLVPWNIAAPTGLAYLTTLRQVNLIECPDLMIPVPALVDWNKNPAVR